MKKDNAVWHSLDNSIKQTLLDVRELLSDKRRWTKYSSASDENGEMVSILDSRACKYCLSGAVELVLHRRHNYSPRSCYVEGWSKDLYRSTFRAIAQTGFPLYEVSDIQVQLPASLTLAEKVVRANDYELTGHKDVMCWIDEAIKLQEDKLMDTP